jgi:predicted site-specific integrase-resolvase
MDSVLAFIVFILARCLYNQTGAFICIFPREKLSQVVSLAEHGSLIIYSRVSSLANSDQLILLLDIWCVIDYT